MTVCSCGGINEILGLPSKSGNTKVTAAGPPVLVGVVVSDPPKDGTLKVKEPARESAEAVT